MRITGMSGTGTSSVAARLAALGYTAIDADQPEWSHLAPAAVPGAPADAPPVLDRVWREDRLRELLHTHRSGPLLVSGGSATGSIASACCAPRPTWRSTPARGHSTTSPPWSRSWLGNGQRRRRDLPLHAAR